MTQAKYLTIDELADVAHLCKTLNDLSRKNIGVDIKVWDVNGECLGLITLDEPGYVFKPWESGDEAD